MSRYFLSCFLFWQLWLSSCGICMLKSHPSMASLISEDSLWFNLRVFSPSTLCSACGNRCGCPGTSPVTGGAKLTCARTDNVSSVFPDGLPSGDVLVRHACSYGGALRLTSHEAHGESHAFHLTHAKPCFSSQTRSGSLVLNGYLWSAP